MITKEIYKTSDIGGNVSISDYRKKMQENARKIFDASSIHKTYQMWGPGRSKHKGKNPQGHVKLREKVMARS